MIGSIPPAGAFLGSLMAGPLMHYIGRKFTVMLTSPIAATSWGLIATAQRWEFLLAGRLLSGVCAGICLPSAQIYVNFNINFFLSIEYNFYIFFTMHRCQSALIQKYVVLLVHFHLYQCRLVF